MLQKAAAAVGRLLPTIVFGETASDAATSHAVTSYAVATDAHTLDEPASDELAFWKPLSLRKSSSRDATIENAVHA